VPSDAAEREGIVRELFERMSTRNFDGVVALLSDDVEFDLAFGPEILEMPVRGRDAMHTLITTVIGAMFNPFRLEVTATYPGADGITIVAEYTSDGVVAHNDRPYLNRYVGIFRIESGLITFWREFHNPEIATAALA
jgi:ketosteroid isomerase-like protein